MSLAAAPSLAEAHGRATSSGSEIHAENVILIISDTLRRDAFSCYGGNWIQTPNFDRFAAQAVVFDNSYIASFPTVNNRNDVLTGRHTFTYKPWSPIDADDVTLQETLEKAGILTSFVVDTPHPFTAGYNYQRGSTAWDFIRGNEVDKYRSAPRSVKFPCAVSKLRDGERAVLQYLRNVAHRRGEEDYFVAQTMRRAAEWLEENNDGRRFFLYVDTYDPHEPWDPPRYYVERYDPGYAGEEVIYPRYDLWRDFLSEKEMHHCRALYAAEATMVDHWIGFLLDRIASLNLLAKTVVILTTDHGFFLGEHGHIGKALVRGGVWQSLPLYPEISHIPLLVYYPGCPGGARIQSLVQPVDLMPTVLDFLKVRQPASVEGKSLVPLLKGRTSKVRDVAIASPDLYQSARPNWLPPPTNRSAITDGEWMLIFGADPRRLEHADFGPTVAVDSKRRDMRVLDRNISIELYNLRDDPSCERDVLSGNRPVASHLHAAFVEFLKTQKIPEGHLQYFEKLWM